MHTGTHPMEREFDLLVIGEINPDLVLTGDVAPAFGQVEKMADDALLTVGSSSCIFACGAARLGLRTAFIGKVGDDDFGRFMRTQLSQRGVDVSGIKVDPRLKTGLSVILSSGDDRAILTYGGSIHELRLEDIDLGFLPRARHLHIGSFYMLDHLRRHAPDLFSQAHAQGLSTSLDTNYDPSERWQGGLQETLPVTDVFFPNKTELLAISGETSLDGALAKLAQGERIVAAKLGAQGGVARQGAQQVSAPALKVNLVDTTGAGDSFDAGFIYAFLSGWDLAPALQMACVCGSLSTRASGGVEAQATLEEALQVIASLHQS